MCFGSVSQSNASATWEQIFIAATNNNCADYTFMVKFLSSPQNVLEA